MGPNGAKLTPDQRAQIGSSPPRNSGSQLARRQEPAASQHHILIMGSPAYLAHLALMAASSMSARASAASLSRNPGGSPRRMNLGHMKLGVGRGSIIFRG